ncbi:hypothetical protein [Frankia sp. Cr1]|nr:hypothetical protein [Frankia sp. Cr1]
MELPAFELAGVVDNELPQAGADERVRVFLRSVQEHERIRGDEPVG